jgi:hypothetical protein
MPETPTVYQLLRYLQLKASGLANAKTDGEITEALGIRSNRLREMVNLLRQTEHLIGSVCTGRVRGYFIPLTREEAYTGKSHLTSRIEALAEIDRAQQRALERAFPVQLTLFDGPTPGALSASTAARSAGVVAQSAVRTATRLSRRTVGRTSRSADVPVPADVQPSPEEPSHAA